MLYQQENSERLSPLEDRRSNPFIRSRQRTNYDRRGSLRVGFNALSFFHDGNSMISGNLKNISDSGACIELLAVEIEKANRITLGIPLLSSRQIDCEISWSKRFDGNNGYGHYGIRFLNLGAQEKNVLRKKFLLDDAVFLTYADGIADKVEDVYTKQEIRSFFLFDLKSAMEKLIDIETMIEQEKEEGNILAALQEAMDTCLECGYRLESMLPVNLVKGIKQRVRVLMGQFLYQSNIFRRAFEKPRGYPGDYEIIEAAYNNRPISEGLGKYFDLYSLELPYTVAIRNRKNKMKELLRRFINTSTAKELKIMNLASGGCREIRELFKKPITYKGSVEIMCIDQDEAAHEYARKKFSGIDTMNVSINLMQGNILRLEQLAAGKDESFDMIYSIGIADYLQDRMLDKIFKDCYKKLKTGGTLVVAYKDREKNKPLPFNWYGDWNFIPRNENEFLELIKNAMGEDSISIRIEREKSGIIFFAEITKIK